MHTNQKTKNEDVDHIGLDKSNVPLIGPIGSGFHLFFILFLFIILKKIVLIFMSSI